jgi:hypothetical protein
MLLLAIAGVMLIVVSSVQAAPVPVAGGHADWGFKESFRSYIQTIAQGTITVSNGASQNGNGTFRFPAGAGGSYDSGAQTGSASFAGSVRFLGHEGTLDMTLSNPRVQLNGTTGTLILDLTSVDEGKTVSSSNIAFAILNLTGITPVQAAGGGGSLTWSNIPTTLTAAGADKFDGFYPAGQALDPLTIRLELGQAPTGTPTTTLTATATSSPQITTTPTTTGTAVVASPTATATVPITPASSGLTWKVSQNAWTSSSLSPAHAAGAPAIKDPNNGFMFPVNQVTYNPATGATNASFLGSLTLGNINQGNYRIKIADPTVVVDDKGAGRLTALVSYCLTTCSTTPVWVESGRVVVVTFHVQHQTAAAATGHVLWTVTPDYPLQNDPNQPTFRQFPQSFLAALDVGLHPHFKDTANQQGVPSASNPNKPPAPSRSASTTPSPIRSEGAASRCRAGRRS